MKKMKQETKKKLVRVFMLLAAIAMILSFVILPLSNSVSAEEADGAVVVSSFETGSLAASIEKAKDGLDLNLVTKIAVSGGTLDSSDYSAICGYPNIEYLELAGADTKDGIIPENALASRNQLAYVSLPANTETIGNRALSGNRALIKVSVPSTVRHIGDYAFEGCEKVEQFNVPAELETLGTGAFSDCKSLSSFEIPEKITDIPEYCFSKASLTQMHFGPQVRSVGSGAFSDCHTLTDIYFYGDTAFSATESAFQNLKVTVHTYDGGKGFDSLSSNFVTVAYDLSEDSVYTPPAPSPAPAVTTAAKNEEAAEDTDKAEEVTAAETEAVTESAPPAAETEQVQTTETEASSGQTDQSSPFSTPAVIIIAVLCLALGVTVTLLVTGRKK